MFLLLRGQATSVFVAEKKMFLKKFRNVFCFSDTKNVSASNVAYARKLGNRATLFSLLQMDVKNSYYPYNTTFRTRVAYFSNVAREIKTRVYGKRQTSEPRLRFLKINNKHINDNSSHATEALVLLILVMLIGLSGVQFLAGNNRIYNKMLNCDWFSTRHAA